MNDPHVVALIYTIDPDVSSDYSQAKPLDCEEDKFSIRIENKKIRFTMKEHYASVEEARQVVKEYIRDWEFIVGLESGPNAFKLDFLKPEIVDRNPPPRQQGWANVSATITAGVPKITAKASALPIPRPYPLPPSRKMKITPDVQSMYDRFMGYRSGKEPLPSMAYFCLTVFEAAAGQHTSRRKAAAKKYGVSQEMLKKIGDLSTNSGGPQARKASGLVQTLTNQEHRFLKEAVAVIIRRAAEVAHDPNQITPEISMSDFSYM